jgi:hypothetical protein
VRRAGEGRIHAEPPHGDYGTRPIPTQEVRSNPEAPMSRVPRWSKPKRPASRIRIAKPVRYPLRL